MLDSSEQLIQPIGHDQNFQSIVIMPNNDSATNESSNPTQKQDVDQAIQQQSASQQDPRVKQLKANLIDSGLGHIEHVAWFNHIGSTNDAIKQLNAPALVISNQQTAGRGQAGRAWYSPTGNLYLSLLCTLQHPLSGRLALEVALSLVNMPLLGHHAGLGIKWPNDLYFNQAKWGGILIEPLHDNKVVIGVGINLNPMPHTIDNQEVTDLSTILGEKIDPLVLATQTTVALIDACNTFEHGSLELTKRFASFDIFLEQKVTVSNAAQADLVGTVIGIQADGALRLSCADGIKIIYSGQVRPLLKK